MLCCRSKAGGKQRKLANEARARKERGYGAKLSMWDSNQCDPKHCSGHWLAQHGYVNRLTVRLVKALSLVVYIHRLLLSNNEMQVGTYFRGIALSHHGTRTISREDLDIVKEHGIVVRLCP